MGLPRRLVVPSTAAGVVMGLVIGLLASTPAHATASSAAPVAQALASPKDEDSPDEDSPDEQVVDQAAELLSGESTSSGGGTSGDAAHPEATMALLEVYRARPRLGFFASLRAQQLLARPTDGPKDRMGDGFEQAPDRRCDARTCVHYVTRGEDRSTRASVRRTLRVWAEVWRHHVQYLGYAAPPSDGRRGGDDRFDVYLTDLGERGMFGYCVPERRVAKERARATSYCVLDNDFARRQYAIDPTTALRVTAAHEFFHAVQFGYDVREDPWLMESTATWIEERFVDGADDNRRFLRHGSTRLPHVSLDRSDGVTLSDYGNWSFWEFLTERHGDDLVRRVWQRAGAREGEDMYSVRALEWALEQRGGLPRALRRYASANLTPALSYAEGARWPSARVDRTRTLGPQQRRVRAGYRIDHLAARHVRLVPDRALRGEGWRLRIRVDGPGWRSAPTAALLIRLRDGTVRRRPVLLDEQGDGVVRLAAGRFDPRRVRDVVVTLVNASTRYRCGKDLHFACGGVPRDDSRAFRVVAEAVRR